MPPMPSQGEQPDLRLVLVRPPLVVLQVLGRSARVQVLGGNRVLPRPRRLARAASAPADTDPRYDYGQ